MLILSLLEGGDMYGYQMIEELSRRSNDLFQMKEGTLYPILHALEKDKCLSSYQQEAPTGRMRKYYKLTRKGRKLLDGKRAEWAARQVQSLCMMMFFLWLNCRSARDIIFWGTLPRLPAENAITNFSTLMIWKKIIIISILQESVTLRMT